MDYLYPHRLWKNGGRGLSVNISLNLLKLIFLQSGLHKIRDNSVYSCSYSFKFHDEIPTKCMTADLVISINKYGFMWIDSHLRTGEEYATSIRDDWEELTHE